MTPADREKLVEAYGRAEFDYGVIEEGGATIERRDEIYNTLLLAKAALLAAMEPVGEEYEVAAMSDGCVSMPVVLLTGPQFDIGDRVRVTRVEGV